MKNPVANRRPLVRVIPVVSIILLVLLSGCFATYGRFALDRQVDTDFQHGVVRAELDYYYAGRETMPYAVIGIDRSYTVPSRYWIPFEPDSAMLRTMGDRIFSEPLDRPDGARILDPHGRTIGIWYSTIHIRSVRVDETQRTVQVLFHNPENVDEPVSAD